MNQQPPPPPEPAPPPGFLRQRWLLLLVIVIVSAAVVVTLRARLGPQAPHPQKAAPETFPIAPDMDTIPGDSTFFGGLESYRQSANAFFRGEESPLDDSDRTTFTGLRFYPPAPDLRFRLRLEPPASADSVIMLDTKGRERVYQRYGTLRFTVEGKAEKLTLFKEPYHRYLFLPFRDATTGKETYSVGRYVEPEEKGDGTILVDFNRAYNPYCAYSHRWACPIPPAENQLDVPIRAGEMKYRDD